MAVTQTIFRLVENLNKLLSKKTSVIPWSSPVPSFGDMTIARVATLGLNPSNKEFVDDCGNELDGEFRRFHTLQSFGIESWQEIDVHHANAIWESCSEYFHNNPYDKWFKKLDVVIAGSGYSYYSEMKSACHLDLIPFATVCKWTHLRASERRNLVEESADTLGTILRDSQIGLLVLNGQSVVSGFRALTGIEYEVSCVDEWALQRQTSAAVSGLLYQGCVSSVGEINLDRKLHVWGFNHNIQSSYGITKTVTESIGSKLSEFTESIRL